MNLRISYFDVGKIEIGFLVVTGFLWQTKKQFFWGQFILPVRMRETSVAQRQRRAFVNNAWSDVAEQFHSKFSVRGTVYLQC